MKWLPIALGVILVVVFLVNQRNKQSKKPKS